MSQFTQFLTKKQKKALTKQNSPTLTKQTASPISEPISEEDAIKKAIEMEDPNEVQFAKELELALEESKKAFTTPQKTLQINVSPNYSPRQELSFDSPYDAKEPMSLSPKIPSRQQFHTLSSSYDMKETMSLSSHVPSRQQFQSLSSHVPSRQPFQSLSSPHDVILSPYELQDNVVSNLEERLRTNTKDQQALQQTIDYLVRQMYILQKDEAIIREDLDKLL